MHPLAQRAYAAFFAPVAPEPAAFLVLAQEVAALTPEGYAALWGDAFELATGQVITADERAAYAMTAPRRLVTVGRLVALLQWAPVWVQRRAIGVLREEAREILPPEAPVTPSAPVPPAPSRGIPRRS